MKEVVRKVILEAGASVCGVANVERFVEAPVGFAPADIWEKCRSVIVYGMALPKGLTEVESRLIYGHFNYLTCSMVDEIGVRAAVMLERQFGCLAVPMPCDGPYEYWEAENLRGKGLISMKHAAVLAGLGTLGKNTLLINPEYGNLLTLGVILTNLDLPSDELCEEMCLYGCRKCIDSCPVGAIQEGTVVQRKCRLNAYGHTAKGDDTVDCNRCRVVCPMRFGKRKSAQGMENKLILEKGM